MTKTQSYHYFRTRLRHAEFLMDFVTLEEFTRFLNQNHIKSLFQLLDEQDRVRHFGVSFKGGLLRQESHGYQTLEDYSDAQQGGYPAADLYYAGKAAGYPRYEDYALVVENGIADRKVIDTMKAQGYMKGFAAWKELAATREDDAANIHNAYQLYQLATQQGYADFAEFREGWTGGFSDAQIFRAAKGSGFHLAAEFHDAQGRGFLTYTVYENACHKGFRDIKDAMRFQEIDRIEGKDCLVDQKLLLFLLSRLEQGKRASINKLYQLFQNELESFRYPDTGEMPVWLPVSMHKAEDLAIFLQNNEAVRRYGQYDVDGEFFEVNRMQDRMVVIDGSNVAHGSCGNKDSKATVRNIRLMIEFLKKHGFVEIIVIADAALRHRLEDKEELKNLPQDVEYIEAPAGRQADAFLLEYVRTKHCLVVSNDTFRDWKVRDEWMAQHIDYYRLSFIIKGEEVLMPDINHS